jgi:hypothetical protein
MEHAVEVLETTMKGHGEKLARVDRMDYSLPVLENAMAIHGDRIRQLEKVAHFAEFTVGSIAGASALVYLYYTLASHFFPK